MKLFDKNKKCALRGVIWGDPLKAQVYYTTLDMICHKNFKKLYYLLILLTNSTKAFVVKVTKFKVTGSKSKTPSFTFV